MVTELSCHLISLLGTSLALASCFFFLRTYLFWPCFPSASIQLYPKQRPSYRAAETRFPAKAQRPATTRRSHVRIQQRAKAGPTCKLLHQVSSKVLPPKTPLEKKGANMQAFLNPCSKRVAIDGNLARNRPDHHGNRRQRSESMPETAEAGQTSASEAQPRLSSRHSMQKIEGNSHALSTRH